MPEDLARRQFLLAAVGGGGAIAGCYARGADDGEPAFVGGGGGGGKMPEPLELPIKQLSDGETFADLTDSSFDATEAIVFSADLTEYRIWRSA